MPRYSESLIEEVRSRNDIVDVIGSYVKLKKQGSNYMGLCPFHSEKSPSFSVSGNKQMYYCFGCHVGGNVITFIQEYENYSFVEAIQFLGERAGIEIPTQELSVRDRQLENKKTRLLQIQKKAAAFYYRKIKADKDNPGYRYLRERGLTDETILHFGLGYTGKGNTGLHPYLKNQGFQDEELRDSGLFTMNEAIGVLDKFWNRVMFPIMDINNRVIGFGGRVMGDAKPKYLNSPETLIFDKSRNLFGMNYARTSHKEQLLLCEGYMDVISLHQEGFTNAVASLGTALTGLQAGLMKRYAKEVLLTYDSDLAGVKAALRAIPILHEAGLSVKVLHLEPYKDPDEFIKALGKDAFEERIRTAQNSFFYEVSVEEAKYDFEDPEQKTEFFNQVARKLADFEEEIERSNYIEAVARQYAIRTEELRRLVNRIGSMMIGGTVPGRYKQQDKERRAGVKPDGGMKQSYRFLLTWLADNPGVYGQIKEILLPEDFRDALYKQVAAMLYEQLEEGDVVPAGIIGHFEDAKDQAAVAAIFHTDFQRELSLEEKEKAINELVRKIKRHSLEEQGREVTDMDTLQRILTEKKNVENVHISMKDG